MTPARALVFLWWFFLYDFTPGGRVEFIPTKPDPIVISGFRWWVDCEDGRLEHMQSRAPFAQAGECREGDPPAGVVEGRRR